MARQPTKGSTRNSGGRQSSDRQRRPYEGPVEWLFPRLEETYTRLGPKEEVEPALRRPRRTAARTSVARAVAAAARTIPHDERLTDGKLEPVARNYWEEVLAQYHRRRLATERPGWPTL